MLLVYITRDLNSWPLLFCTTTVDDPLTTCALVTSNAFAIDKETGTAKFNRGIFRGLGNAGLYLIKYFGGFLAISRLYSFLNRWRS